MDVNPAHSQGLLRGGMGEEPAVRQKLVYLPVRSTPRDKPERSDNNSMDTQYPCLEYRRAKKWRQF